MKLRIYIYLCLSILLYSACNNDYTIDMPQPDEFEPPVTVEPITLLEECFNEQKSYLSPFGEAFPDKFSDGYFERLISENNNEKLSLKVFLNKCKLNTVAEPVTYDGGTSSKGYIHLKGNESSIETIFFGKVSSLSLIMKNISTKECKSQIMFKTIDNNWEIFAESPTLSVGEVTKWTIEEKIMQYPIALKINAIEGDIALYDLYVTGNMMVINNDETLKNILFDETFTSDKVKTFFTSSGTIFPSEIWGDGYFIREIQDEKLKVTLKNCMINYDENPISIYGFQTSKGMLQIGENGYIEFPTLGSIDGLVISCTGNQEGTNIIVSHKKKGESTWHEVINNKTPVSLNLKDISENSGSIRISSSKSPLSIYDLKLSGKKDISSEDRPNITLIDERFRDDKIYFDAATNTTIDRNTFYDEIYFKRNVEEQILDVRIYDGRIHTTQKPPTPENGATQGRLILNPQGSLVTPIFGSIKSIVMKLQADDEGNDIRVKLELKKAGSEQWEVLKISEPLKNDAILSWELEDVTNEAAAYRISSASNDKKIAIYNLTIKGKLF